jgi:hypothetical protein
VCPIPRELVFGFFYCTAFEISISVEYNLVAGTSLISDKLSAISGNSINNRRSLMDRFDRADRISVIG